MFPFKDVYISGTGSYLPSNVVSNQKLYKNINNFDIELASNSLSKKGIDIKNFSEEDIFDAWVQQVTGIAQRTFFSAEIEKIQMRDPLEIVEIMAKFAAEKAIDDAGLKVKDIDHLVFSSYSSEVIIPGQASTLANLLGMENISGININGACSGFLDALIDAAIKVGSGIYHHILVVAAEYMSNKINYEDPTTAILFGDGAGACVVSRGKEGILSFKNILKYNKEHIYMNRQQCITMGGGPLVQRKAVEAMSSVSEIVLNHLKMKIEDFDYLIPHQANLRILHALEKKMDIENNSSCQMIKCIKNTGNLSSSTLPVALDLLRKGKLEITYLPKNKSLLTSVGGGYTFSALALQFN